MKIKNYLNYSMLLVLGIVYQGNSQVDNAFFGQNTGANNTGNYNTAIGKNALRDNVSNSNNAFGADALRGSQGGFNVKQCFWNQKFN
jgi:hypothetical protein